MKKGRFEFFASFPTITWLIVFFLVPTAMIFAFAFKPFDIYGGVGEGWTLNTLIVLLNVNFLVSYWQTLWISVLTTLIALSIALPVGYFMAKTTPTIRHICLLLVVVPFWSSFLIRIFAWKSLLHPEGFFKQILVALHVVNPDTLLLYNSGAVLLVLVYSYLPFAILPIFASASKFNFHLMEAALDLGASKREAFIKVFLPGIKTGIITAILMVFIPTVGAYVIPDVVGGPNSEMIGNKIAQKIFVDRNLPAASALSGFLSLVVLLPMALFYINSKISKKGLLDARMKE